MPDVLVASALPARALGAKIVLDLHDPMPELMRTIFNLPERSASVRLITLLEKWSIACSNAVVTVNIACKRLFSSRSCPAAKISVVMNSPDETIIPFQPVTQGARGIRDGNMPFMILYHGSIVERNGLDLAIAALARLRRAVRGAELRIAGHRTPFLDQALDQARKLDVHDRVRFLGPRRLEDLAHDIAACDVGVIPNHCNAFTAINTPTRIFEYLALGKPVIAPRTPGILDYFGPDSLVYFDPGNEEDLARCLEFVALHPEDATGIAARGQDVYSAHRWSRERDTFVGLIRALLLPEYADRRAPQP